MVIEIPAMLFESWLPALCLLGGLLYQGVVLKVNMTSFKDKLDKIELQMNKITDILVQQESHTQRIDALETRLVRIEDDVTESFALRTKRTARKA